MTYLSQYGDGAQQQQLQAQLQQQQMQLMQQAQLQQQQQQLRSPSPPTVGITHTTVGIPQATVGLPQTALSLPTNQLGGIGITGQQYPGIGLKGQQYPGMYGGYYPQAGGSSEASRLCKEMNKCTLGLLVVIFVILFIFFVWVGVNSTAIDKMKDALETISATIAGQQQG